MRPVLARRQGRPRRPSAAGAGPRAAGRGLPRRLAGRLRCRAAGRRIVRLPDRLRPGRPHGALRPPRGRRPAPAAAHQAASLGRDDRRSVPVAWRGPRCGVASRAGRCGRCALPRGRRRPAADRLEPAGRRHAARSRAVGASGRVPALDGQSASVSACAPNSCATRRPSSSAAMRRARAARRLLRIRRDRLRVVRLAPRPGFGLWPPAGSEAATAGLRERLGLADRYLVFTGRFDARLDLATLLGALATLAATGRPARLHAAVPWPPRVLLVGASPADRASVARAAAAEGDRRGPGVRSEPRSGGACRARSWRPSGRPPRAVGGGRVAGDRGARVRDTGRGVIGWADPRARRPRRLAGRARRSRSAGRGAVDDLGR